MELYAHQQDAVDETLGAVLFGSNNIVIDAPTSFGKSLVIAELSRKLEGNIIVLITITDLLDQIAEHLDELGLEYSMLKAGRDKEFDENQRIQIVMSQTYYSRREKLNLKADYIIQDERHKEYATDRTRAIESDLKPKAVIGLSGTPYDQAGYALHNAELIRTISVKDLTKMGFLCPIKYMVPYWSEKVDYSGVSKSGNDYSVSQLEQITTKKDFLDNCANALEQVSIDKKSKTVVVCSSIEQADTYVATLQKKGFSAYAYHSKVKNQAEIMKSFKFNEEIIIENELAKDNSLFSETEKHETLPKVDVLVSVSKVTTGFSVKDILIIQSLRPTTVMSLFRQIVGRGCRVHPDKEYTILLDCAQNVATHGFHDEDYDPPQYDSENPEQAKANLLKAKAHLAIENMSSIMEEDSIEEMTRDKYEVKMKELKDKLNSTDLEGMDIVLLIKAFELATDPEHIIAISCEIMTQVNGRPISARGYEYDYNAAHLSEEFVDAFADYPQCVSRWTKALKTRCRNIIRENKKLYAIKFFPEFLIKNYEEESRSIVEEYTKKEYKNNQEPEGEVDSKNNEIDPDDIDFDEIPF